MENILEKLESFRKNIIDKDYPLGIDEILGEIEYLFEDDKEVSEVIQSYADDYYKMWSCAEKFYKVKDLIDEEFYTEQE